MGQVFISYARDDRRVAKKLAEKLERAGLSVWWDTDLLPHQNFIEAINATIDAARAVIVIWSSNATASEFVLSEAERARQQKKLISVKVDSFDPGSLPAPFNLRQTTPVSELAVIIAALGSLGVGNSVQVSEKRSDKAKLNHDETPSEDGHKGRDVEKKGDWKLTVWLLSLVGFLSAVVAAGNLVPEVVEEFMRRASP